MTCSIFNEWKKTVGAGPLLLWGRCLTFAIWGLMLADVIWLAVDYYLKQQEASQKGRGPTPASDKAKLEALQSKLDKAKTPVAKLAASTAVEKFKAQKQSREAKFLDNLDSVEEWGAMMERLAKVDFSPWALRLFLLVGPILFYSQIFDPCFSCYDFQAAVTHEIGHVLGLGHPDQAATVMQNIMIDRTAGESLALNIGGAAAAAYGQGDPTGIALAALTAEEKLQVQECGGFSDCLVSAKIDCWNPWTRTALRPNNSETVEAYAPTIMAAFTFNNPSTCIFQDDLDAINVLYPVCSSMAVYPVCTQPKTYLGVIRFTVYVGIPVFALLLSMILLNKLAYKAQMRGQAKQKQQMKDSLRLITKDGKPLTKGERKVIQWRAQIAELQLKRRKLLAAGKTLKNSQEMVKVQQDIRKKEQKIKEAEMVSAPAEDDDSSDSDDDSLLENLLQGDFLEIFSDLMKPLKQLFNEKKRGKTGPSAAKTSTGATTTSPDVTMAGHSAGKTGHGAAIRARASSGVTRQEPGLAYRTSFVLPTVESFRAPPRCSSARVAVEPPAEVGPRLVVGPPASPALPDIVAVPQTPSLAVARSHDEGNGARTLLPPLEGRMHDNAARTKDSIVLQR